MQRSRRGRLQFNVRPLDYLGRDMGMHLHRSDRTDALADALAGVLAEPPVDPFTPDVVAVPTRGIERFLAQRLAGRLGVSTDRADGVCANVAFPTPSAVVDRVLAQCVGIDPMADPWRPERLLWVVLAALTQAEPAPWARPLRQYLARGAQSRRHALSEHLTSLLTGYSLERPGMVREWLTGGAGNGLGGALPSDLGWAPPLMREVRQLVGVPGPAERLAQAAEVLRHTPELVDLPERISVFGATRLPATHLSVFAALAAKRDVHMWLADPCPSLWPQLEPGTGAGTKAFTTRSRQLDDSGRLAAHPLLRSLGRDARELGVRLRHGAAGPLSSDTLHPAAGCAHNLLGWLRADILANRLPAAAGRSLRPDDQSISVHACHGQARQAEVLREVVLGLLANDPTLEPRDIIVMCPDLATFAPLISAAFAGPLDSPVGELRVRIADRTPEQSNEVLGALSSLLELLDSRIGAAALLDFAELPAVRRRLGLSADDLARLRELTVQVGVHWGIDAGHRADFQLAGLSWGTWLAGVDRMVLGVGLSEDGLPTFGGTLPLDDIASTDLGVVAAATRLVSELQRARELLTRSQPLRDWVALLQEFTTTLTAPDPAASWQMSAALGALAGFSEAAGERADVCLALGDIRGMLARVLAGRPTRSNFRSGGLTVCGLAPMRSVPHRVIALVGLDDGQFPRSAIRDGDDLTMREPALGERDPRSEDRQILLDAIIAATEHLVITYCGADDRTNELMPACVPVAELLDCLDATAHAPAAAGASPIRVREQVLTQHPLQPFDRRNFQPGALRPGPRPFSHDITALAAAVAAASPREPLAPFLTTALQWQSPPSLTLAELTRFLVNPAGEFLRGRLALSLKEADDPLDDNLPIEPDALAKWTVGERLLNLTLHGAQPGRLAEVEHLRGALPPGELGSALLRDIGQEVERIAAATQAHRGAGAAGQRLAINLRLPSGRRLVGSVRDIYGSQEELLVRATFSTPTAKHELPLWVDLLAATATRAGQLRPDERKRGVLEGRKNPITLHGPATAEEALIRLDELVALFDAGMRTPLPLAPKTSRAYAQVRRKRIARSVAFTTAERQFNDDKFPGECSQPALRRIYGAQLDLRRFSATPAPPDEAQWFPDEPTRFGALSRRLWEPILVAEEGG